MDSAALDCRLVDAVFVTQRIAVAGLGAEVLRGQYADARDALVLLTSDRKRAASLFLGIGECAHADVDLTCGERLVPVLWIVDAVVAKLPCARRHADAKSLWKALQRLLGKSERFEARVADSNVQPGIGGDPRAFRRIDIWCQAVEKRSTRFSIIDAQEQVCAEIRRRPRSEDGRLDFVQVECRRLCQRIPAKRFLDGRHV